MKELNEKRIKQVSCAGNHALALSGTLFSTLRSGLIHVTLGVGEVWELGEEQNHDTNDVISPSKKIVITETPPVRPMPALAGIPVSSVSAGEGHFIVQSATGQLYAWGLNNFGQLGLGDVAARAQPTLISELHHLVVTKVVCGAFHSLVLTSEYTSNRS